MPAQRLHVVDQVPRGVALQVGVESTRVGSASPAASLIEQHHAVDSRVEQATLPVRAPGTGPTVYDHGRLAARIAAGIPVHVVPVADGQPALLRRLDRRIERCHGGAWPGSERAVTSPCGGRRHGTRILGRRRPPPHYGRTRPAAPASRTRHSRTYSPSARWRSRTGGGCGPRRAGADSSACRRRGRDSSRQSLRRRERHKHVYPSSIHLIIRSASSPCVIGLGCCSSSMSCRLSSANSSTSDAPTHPLC